MFQRTLYSWNFYEGKSHGIFVILGSTVMGLALDDPAAIKIIKTHLTVQQGQPQCFIMFNWTSSVSQHGLFI